MFYFCKELRIWDISSHRCLKSVRLHFPCQKPAHILEHGNFPFLLPSPSHCQRAHLVVGCKDNLALLPLAEWKGGEGDWSGASRYSSPPVLCSVQPQPEAAGDRAWWLVRVHMGRGDGEEEASHLKCAEGGESHLLGAGLLPQTADHRSLQWQH